MIYSGSCRHCDNSIEIIIPPKSWFDFPVKINACRILIGKLYEQKYVWPDLEHAVWNIFEECGNQGFIIEDQIERQVPGELFPEIINTGSYIVCLPVEGVNWLIQ